MFDSQSKGSVFESRGPQSIDAFLSKQDALLHPTCPRGKYLNWSASYEMTTLEKVIRINEQMCAIVATHAIVWQEVNPERKAKHIGHDPV